MPEHRRLQVEICAQRSHQAAEAKPPGLLRLLFHELRLAGGRGMCGQVKGRAELAIERVHLETRVFRCGGEERRWQVIRLLPQLECAGFTRGEYFFARFGRYSGYQGVADRLQSLRGLFHVVAENLHAAMHGTLALHANMQSRKHQQAEPYALRLAEQSAITHGFHGPFAVEAGESFLRLRAMGRRGWRRSGTQRLFRRLCEFEKQSGERSPFRFIAPHRPERHRQRRL